MELFSAEFFSALLSIIVIDLVLAGDNAIVIGLAARNLPKEQQKKSNHLGNCWGNHHSCCSYISCCLAP